MNAAFNSICPLLDVDNGIFFRDNRVAEMAAEIIGEAIEVTKRIGLDLEEKALMAQFRNIASRRSIWAAQSLIH